jgi:hypothetical protein
MALHTTEICFALKEANASAKIFMSCTIRRDAIW